MNSIVMCNISNWVIIRCLSGYGHIGFFQRLHGKIHRFSFLYSADCWSRYIGNPIRNHAISTIKKSQSIRINIRSSLY
jgi:hypothetical protein